MSITRLIKYFALKFKFPKNQISYSADISIGSDIGIENIVGSNVVLGDVKVGDHVSFSDKVRVVRSYVGSFSAFYYGTELNESTIGSFVKLRDYNSISHSHIGDYSYTSHRAKIQNTTIGKFCAIGPDVKIGLGIHPTDFLSIHPIFYSDQLATTLTFADVSYFVEHKNVVIGNDVWIGANVLIADGVVIGNGAIIAAGAVVVKDVEPYSIVGGVPAKQIKKRFSDEMINSLNKLCWWDFNQSKLKEVSGFFRRSGLTNKDIDDFIQKLKHQ